MKRQKRASKRPHRFWQLTALSLGVGLLSTIIYKFMEGFEWPTLWMGMSLLLELFIVWFLYALIPSVWRVLAIQFLLGLLLRGMNAAKIHYLNTPLLPSDFFLVDEVYRVSPFWLYSLLLFGVVVPLLICCGLLWRGFHWPSVKRALLMIPAVFIFSFLIFVPQTYSDVFDHLLENELYGIPFLMEERQQALGVPLSFSIDVAKFLAVAEKTPSKEEAKAALQELARLSPVGPVAAVGPKRNVYIFLIESFWDPSWLIDVPAALDDSFRKLWVAGGEKSLLSPMFGGGTANVEFEMLCGLPSRSVSKGIIFQVSFANEIPCVPKVLRDQGYRTFAFHGFESGYFNRNTAFPIIGFEKFEAAEDLIVPYEKGSFLTDQDLFHLALERSKVYAGSEPRLTYIMTFAGHWPFAWVNGYETEILLPGSNADSKLSMLERHLNINRMASRVVFESIESIQKEDPEALIVVAGDHLPALGLAGKSPDMSDWKFYHTPLLILDPLDHSRSTQKIFPAYSLAAEILNRVGVPTDHQGYIAKVRSPANLIIRPEQNNATFVSQDNGQTFTNCTPTSKDPQCASSVHWLSTVKVIARDLVVGAQHSL